MLSPLLIITFCWTASSDLLRISYVKTELQFQRSTVYPKVWKNRSVQTKTMKNIWCMFPELCQYKSWKAERNDFKQFMKGMCWASKLKLTPLSCTLEGAFIKRTNNHTFQIYLQSQLKFLFLYSSFLTTCFGPYGPSSDEIQYHTKYHPCYNGSVVL
jgi:hypothetical protein